MHFKTILFILISFFSLQITSAQYTNKFTPIGPEEGDVLDIVIDPTDSTIMYSKVSHLANYWIYKTTNGGENWNRISTLPGYTLYLEIDPNNPNILYSDGEGYIYKSTDSGVTWLTKSFNRSETITVYGIEINGINSQIIYVSGVCETVTDRNICFLKTEDGGETWTISTFLGSNSMGWAVDPKDYQTFYLATYDPISSFDFFYRSTDGGNIWFELNILINPIVSVREHIQCLGSDMNGNIYINLMFPSKFYKSTDKGDSWILVRSIQRLDKIECYTGNPDFIAGSSGENIYTSTDGGDNWILSGTAPEGYSINTLKILSESHFIIGTNVGVFTTTDAGTTWNERVSGFDIVTVDALAVSGSSPENIYTVLSSGSVYRSTNSGADWSRRENFRSLTSLVIDDNNPDLLYALKRDNSYSSSLHKTTDNGTSWEYVKTFGEALDIKLCDSLIFVTHRSIGAKNPTLAKSTDGGISWEDFVITTADGYPRSIVLNPHNRSVLYIAGQNGNKGAVFKSTDGGENWNLLYESSTVSEFKSIVIDATDTSTLYIAGDSGIDRSKNGGVTWENISDISCISLCTGKNGVIYSTGNDKIMISSDNDETWDYYQIDSNVRIIEKCLAVDEKNNIVYVGTEDKGVLALQLDTGTRVKENIEREVIAGFKLLYNYPNPFNQETGIRFQVSGFRDQGLGNVRVKLAIYNILGQHVRTLVDEEKPEGTYRVYWNGRDKNGQAVPSGVYFYRLQAGDFSEVKKMILLK